jgi:hypothetical protein
MANGDDKTKTPIPSPEDLSALEQEALLRKKIAEEANAGRIALEAVQASMKLDGPIIEDLNKKNKTRLNLLEKQIKLQALGKDLSADELKLLTDLTSETEEFDRQLRIANEARRQEIDLKQELLSLGNKLTGVQLDELTTVKGLTSAIISMAHSLDAAQVALAKTTGYTTALNEDMKNMVGNTRGMGIGIAKAGEIVGGLNSQFTLFATLNAETRESMGRTTAMLEKMGVAAADTGAFFDGLTRGMGMSVKAAEQTAKDFDKLSQQLGLPTSQMIKDFGTLQKQLARYGTQGKKVFMDLQKQARGLGMAVQDAFNIAEAFDTFQGAADLAGKLNAQIGLQLNSVQMMTASHADRIKILRQEFDLRGKNFKDMGRRQRQAIAEVLGVDVDMASRLFGDPVKLRKYQKEQKAMAERAEAMTTAMDKFRVALEDVFLALSPVIEGTLAFVRFLADTGILQIWLAVAAFRTFLGIFMSMGKVLPLVTGMFTKLGTSLGLVGSTGGGGLLTSLGVGLKGFWKALSTISWTQIAKGALVLAILAGSIALLGLAMGTFVEVGMGEVGVATAAIALLGLAIIGLGAVMFTGVGAVLFAAGVAALLSLAVALGSLGLALGTVATNIRPAAAAIKDSFGSITKTIVDFYEKTGPKIDNTIDLLGKMALGLTLIAIAFMNPLLLVGIGIFTAALYGIAGALALIAVSTDALGSLEKIITVSTKVSTSDLDNMRAVMGEVQATFSASNAADKVALRSTATATANVSAGRNKMQRQRQPVQLVVKDRVFGEVVMETYDEHTDPLAIS